LSEAEPTRVGQPGGVIKCMLALSLLQYVALIGGAVLFGNLASAHDFYDEKCCHERDCPSGELQ
jgi:hypothetical protein